jgi:phospholipid/cholesterol/gamma-HCH transport system substrate-binding protein
MARGPQQPQPKDYDERIYRKGHPPHRARNALILIFLLVVGTYLGWTKELPFGSEYELKAVFENAANIRQDSPVRIAGVDVGKVTSVRRVGDAAEVTFTVDDAGRPIRDDATVQIRPRIFLEGNFFMDVQTGTPGAPELPDGGTVPITQTATAVQLDEILTSLQAPSRENLKAFLEGYGTALTHIPSAAEDIGQDPDVQGETAAQAINDSFQYGGPAGRDSAIVNEALLGTEPHDLSNLLASQGQVFRALLSREAQLKDLITNFNTTAGAFAAESINLGKSIRLLAPTLVNTEVSLRHTNEVFPFLRAFARDITPGIRELPATIAAAGPWLRQTNALLGRNELGYIADELRRAAPGAGIAASKGVSFLRQVELLSRCADQVLLPTGDPILADTFSTGVPNYKEFGYAVAGFAGETQNFDGNGPYLRFQSGGGPQRVRMAQPGGGFENDFLFADSISAPIGTQPVLGPKPTFRVDRPCHQNSVPDLNGPAAAVGPPSPAAVP